MRRGVGDEGWWFDTSHLTPAQTAERMARDAANFDPLT